MKIKVLALLAAVCALALADRPAVAAKKRPPEVDQSTRITVIDETGRARTRITVRRRSFLDPGTASLPLNQHYHDYAFPLNYSAYYDSNDWKGSWSRMPLPAPLDVPGWRNY